MKSPILCFGIMALALGVAVGTPVCGATDSGIQAKLVTAAEVNLAKTDTLPVAISVSSQDGKAYSGQIDLWTSCGEVVDSKGAAHRGMLRLTVTDGKADAKLKLADGQVGDAVEIQATIGASGDRELLGSTKVVVRRPKTSAIVEDETVLAVCSNGAARPRVAVLVKDQFGNPLPDCEVSAICKLVDASVVTRTNSEGVALIELPAYGSGNLLAVCQVNVGANVFAYRSVCWTEDGTAAIYGK